MIKILAVLMVLAAVYQWTVATVRYKGFISHHDYVKTYMVKTVYRY